MKPSSLRIALSDNKLLRDLTRFFFSLGDNVRPIVQRPLIRHFLGRKRVDDALDAGCGRGMYTRLLVPIASRVAAFDFSREHINRNLARQREFPNVEFQVGSATDIPYPNNAFDLVLHAEVLEHIVDDRKALSELFRVLKPGGRLVLSTPVPPAPYDDSQHVREGYEPDNLFAMLKEAGFSVIRHQFCMFRHSKSAMLRTIWWDKKFSIPMPNVLLLPLYWERLISSNWGRDKVPYDIIVEAIKPFS